jgi:hypothetical protein
VVEDKNGQPRKEFFDLKPEVRLRVLRGKYELADRQALIQFIKKYKELDRPK